MRSQSKLPQTLAAASSDGSSAELRHNLPAPYLPTRPTNDIVFNAQLANLQQAINEEKIWQVFFITITSMDLPRVLKVRTALAAHLSNTQLLTKAPPQPMPQTLAQNIERTLEVLFNLLLMTPTLQLQRMQNYLDENYLYKINETLVTQDTSAPSESLENISEMSNQSVVLNPNAFFLPMDVSPYSDTAHVFEPTDTFTTDIYATLQSSAADVMAQDMQDNSWIVDIDDQPQTESNDSMMFEPESFSQPPEQAFDQADTRAYAQTSSNALDFVQDVIPNPSILLFGQSRPTTPQPLEPQYPDSPLFDASPDLSHFFGR